MESNTWCPRLTAAMILSGSRGRSEVEDKARVASKPLQDFGMLVRGIVVDDGMDREFCRASPDCPVYDGWCAFLGSRFHADKPCLPGNDWLPYTRFLHSLDRRMDCIIIDAGRRRWGQACGMRRRRQPVRAARYPPVGGAFSDSNFRPALIPGNLV